jgi:hypothetical protein
MTQQTANLSNRALEPIVVQESREKAQRSQPQMLTDFARDADLFHSPEGEAYAVISVNDHYESWPIRHRQFRLWLIDRFYQKEEKPPPAQAVTDALTALEAKALRRGPKRAVFTRLAMADSRNHPGGLAYSRSITRALSPHERHAGVTPPYAGWIDRRVAGLRKPSRW